MTYLCETIRALEDDKVRQDEIKQRANEAARTKHPETGEPIRRVILGGWGLVTNKSPSLHRPRRLRENAG